MFEIEIGGEKIKAEVSFYTAQLYEAEFSSDIIKDFFGKSDLASPVKLANKGGAAEVVSVDFTKTNWTAAMKALWASVKTADELTPGYYTWVRKCSGVNMWEVQDVLANEIADCFFRAGAAAEEAE
jgi:hypothetical protein